MKLQMECDYGIFTRSAIKKEVILHGDDISGQVNLLDTSLI